jgi:hypothetical protein
MEPVHMEKVYLPSGVRRERTAVTPVWRVQCDGALWQFKRKSDAERFEQHGCSDHSRIRCSCGGSIVIPAPSAGGW